MVLTPVVRSVVPQTGFTEAKAAPGEMAEYARSTSSHLSLPSPSFASEDTPTVDSLASLLRSPSESPLPSEEVREEEREDEGDESGHDTPPL